MPHPSARRVEDASGVGGIIGRVTGKSNGFGQWLKTDEARRLRYGISDSMSTMFAGLAGISPGGTDTSSLGRAAMHATGSMDRASARVRQENFGAFIDRKLEGVDRDSEEALRLMAIRDNPTAAMNLISAGDWRERLKASTDAAIRRDEAGEAAKAKHGTSYAAQQGAKLQADKDFFTWKEEREDKRNLTYINNLWNTLPKKKRDAMERGDQMAFMMEFATNREFEKMWPHFFMEGGPLDGKTELRRKVWSELGSQEDEAESVGRSLFGFGD